MGTYSRGETTPTKWLRQSAPFSGERDINATKCRFTQ